MENFDAGWQVVPTVEVMTDAVPRERAASPAVLHALGRTHRATRNVADDLLAHLPEVGDAVTQRALDAWVEQAADTMRALTEALEERLLGGAAGDAGAGSGGSPLEETTSWGLPR